MCSCESESSPSSAVASRRRFLTGGVALGAAALLTTPAGAARPLPPGSKPDPFFLFLGRKPAAPDRPLTTGPFQARGSAPTQAPGGAPAVASRSPAAGPHDHRTLTLDNINTGERLTVTYMEQGRYLPDALAAINRLMRDRRTDEVAPIDPALLDLMCDIRSRLETATPLQIISGYRAPDTNAQMRRSDRAVARKSYHTLGMAADIAVPGCPIPTLRRVAVALGRGGVGDYPRSGFVHVDVGPPRTW